MAKRNYPNDNYVWYNDDNRVAILERTSSSDTTTTQQAWDSFQSSGDSGTITNMLTDGSTVTATTSSAHGLTTDDYVVISGSATYDGTEQVTVTSTTTFTFASTAIGATADTVQAFQVVGTLATGTFATSSHGLSVGDVVYIDATNDTYDEKVTLLTAGSTTFTYSTLNDAVSTGSITGTIGQTGTFTRSNSGGAGLVGNGYRLTYHSKYVDTNGAGANAQTDDLKSTLGLDSGMHQYVLCYIKARLFEDVGDLQKAQYYRKMFELGMNRYPMRKSGVRVLSVPRI